MNNLIDITCIYDVYLFNVKKNLIGYREVYADCTLTAIDKALCLVNKDNATHAQVWHGKDMVAEVRYVNE